MTQALTGLIARAMGSSQYANSSFHLFASSFQGRTFIRGYAAEDIFPRIRQLLCILLSYPPALRRINDSKNRGRRPCPLIKFYALAQVRHLPCTLLQVIKLRLAFRLRALGCHAMITH
ncbi:conserved protein of unknown function [Desulfovibrio sp. 86]|nr:conserved protein of unknown function [Desulfovibrio sp. 86]